MSVFDVIISVFSQILEIAQIVGIVFQLLALFGLA